MADTRPAFGRDDLRAAVAAGLLTEAQAAGLLALAEARAGTRARMPEEDEPFELFRGFAEIFVSVGLVLLIAGVSGVSALVGAPALVIAVSAGLCWLLARYFTLRRRMVLPSIVLACGFALAVAALASWLVGRSFRLGDDLGGAGLLVCALVGAALAAWYAVFRLPFTMFLIGLTGLAAIFTLTASITPEMLLTVTDWQQIFDLRGGSGFGLATLGFGVIALAGGLWFDMRDPHRLGRHAASGFWLHVLAAPALVNTVALTFFNMGPGRGYLLLGLALFVIALLALVIDRRSFLTAGIGYLAFLIGLLVRSGGSDEGFSWVWVALILGIFVTALGAYWTDLRGLVMRALPEFPGKRRLPPYPEAK